MPSFWWGTAMAAYQVRPQAHVGFLGRSAYCARLALLHCINGPICLLYEQCNIAC